jgi:uncharacterized protein YwgA
MFGYCGFRYVGCAVDVVVSHMVNKPLLYSVFKTAVGDSSLDPTADIDTRIFLQKIAFFAQEALGIPVNAAYTLYIHGPYSPEVARVYYEDDFAERVRSARVLDNPRAVRVLRALAHKDVRWLEVAATYYHFKRKGLDDRSAALWTSNVKSISADEVAKIATELAEVLESL